jgi:hypothetical protein
MNLKMANRGTSSGSSGVPFSAPTYQLKTEARAATVELIVEYEDGKGECFLGEK